jgi:hypothetical protein
MTVEILISVFAILLVIAGSAERFIEIVKPGLEKTIKDPSWLISAKVAAAVLMSFALAAFFHFDLLARLGIVGTLPVIGYAAAGLFASIGSSGLHAILEWLKTIKQPNDVTTVTDKTTHSESTPPAPPAVG